MAKYLRIDVHTYYLADDACFYLTVGDDLNDEEIERWACEIADEYAEDRYVWSDYEYQGYETEDEWEDTYFSNCGYKWEKISREEYEYETC